jgi:hypothetical protein
VGTHPGEAPVKILRRRIAMNDVDSVGGYAVPVDPMDDLQCESCQ